MAEDCLDEKTRAEDIILGALGLAEDAKIISIKRTKDGYTGIAAWSDGEQFPFESEDELTELDEWALSVLLKNRKQQ